MIAAAGLFLGFVAWWGWRTYRAAPLAELPEIDLTQAPTAVKTAIVRSVDAVRAHPRSGQAWGRLGLVLRAHEFGTEADACLAMAGRLEPREFLWPYILGVSLTVSDPDGAIACFRRAALLRPTDPLPHERLGELLLQEPGQTDEAAREFEQALHIEPDSARGRLGLARCRLLEGNLEESRRLAAEAARPAAGQRAVHELLLHICRRLGDEQQAAAEEGILAQLPAGETTWEDPYVAQVLELRQDPQWLSRAAQRLIDAGRLPEGISRFEELIAADDSNPQWKMMLAEALISAGDHGRAAEVIDRGIGRHPESPELRLRLGALLFLRRDWSMAAEAFREAIRLKPDYSEAHYNLGHALRRLGDSEGAIAALREAVRFQPAFAAAHANLGELLVAAGQPEEGLEHLRLAVKLDPSDSSARQKLKESD
jgi:tetratricopeptide (TPR) repeat protein